MKKIIHLLLFTTLICILTACGSDKDEKIEYSSTAVTNSSYSGVSYSGGSFTNKYGTSTTKCYISGCSNYIASSGDTNCCSYHSNRCPECYKYIDSDAMYCMDCLRSYFEN